LAFAKKMEIDITNGASGPTIVISISIFFANAKRPSKSSALMSAFSVFGSSAVPAFPGATKIFLHKLL
jgi:hypothetical protein